MNLCASCGRNFGSQRAFGRHRTGVHAYTFAEGATMQPPRYDGRRCLSDHELRAAGLVPNARGELSLARDLARARAFPAAKLRTSPEDPAA
jgi:hypothetical protein